MQESTSNDQVTKSDATKKDGNREIWIKPELTIHSIIDTTLSANQNFANEDSVNNYS